MKLLFLSSYAHLVLDPESKMTSGGAELQVALLARELASRGHKVTILAGDTGQRDGGSLQGVLVRTGGKFHTGRIREMLLSIPRVIRVLREERPEWVCVLGWTAWLFVLWLIRPLLGFRMAFICGLDTEVNGEFRKTNPLRGGLFEFAMKRCDIRFAMTLLQEKLFRERGMSCFLYRNLILSRTGARQSKKSTDFLWVARCRSIKRPHLFLDLAEKIPEASFEMICPPEDPVLFEEIRKRGSNLPNVILRESVPYHSIQQHYDAARVFVNTSEWEGWANSLIQAGQGEAAILSLNVRPDTLFDDYALGFCADDDSAEFTEAAIRMWKDSSLTEQMGKESARFVTEMHDNGKETENFLVGLATGAGRTCDDSGT